MKTNNPDDWIKHLGLIKHPEGGYFKEVYRSDETISSLALPERFAGDRAFSTSIFYLLKQGEYSKFHKIKSDETWHFYDGSPLELLIIDFNGTLKKVQIGLNPASGLIPQFTVPAGHWFAAHSLGEYTLLGCTVSPGFDFTDFEMANQKTLITAFPQCKKVIKQFT